MPFSILCNAADWEKYQQRTAGENQMSGLASNWGNGPPDYPCLAATKFLPGHTLSGGTQVGPKFLSVFVTLGDAKALFEAAGVPIGSDRGSQPAAGSVNQQKTNEWLSAHILALVALLEDTKILGRDAYEERLIEALDAIRAWRTDDKEKLREKMSQARKDVLDRLPPTG